MSANHPEQTPERVLSVRFDPLGCTRMAVLSNVSPRSFPRTALRLRGNDGTLVKFDCSIGLSAALGPRVRVARAGVTSKGGAR
jgi:hypothetical protein